jgi:hypothetical protein
VTIEPYPIMAEGDRIKLSWGGEIIWATVEPQHLPPQNVPLVITVDEATILKAGDTDTNGLAVVFEVYDVVDNKSADWSAEVRVIVDTGNSRLLAPLIKESFNLVLDMDQLGEADLTFQVFTLGNDFAVGDEIEMSLSGLTASGERVEKVYPPEVITNASGITEFKRPSAEVRQLAGGLHAAFFYRLIKADGSDDLTSKVFSPRIIGRANPLAAPIPLDEIAGTLDPQLPGTTIEIPLDPAMEEGNAIALIWNGITETGSPYIPDLPLHPLSKNEAEGSVPIEIAVAGEHLTAIEGGTLDLYYKLLRDAVSREVIEEESLHADLLTIGMPQAELPPPVVEGESDGVLDPADKPNGTRLIVRQYSGQEAGDQVHILWWGSITGRYRDSLPVTEVTANQDIPFTISAALIEGNRNGTVRAMYWVRRVGGGTSPSEILLMSIGAGMDLTAPSVKQATGSSPTQQLNPVAAKDALTVVIPDYGVQPGDQVSVTWAGTAGAGSYTKPASDLPSNREIDLPVSVIAYNLGRPVTVTYTVTRNGNESDPSAALNLAVQTIAENDLSGSKPKILQAANNGEGLELDVASLTGNATVRIDSWPLIAVNQYVWLRVKGKNNDDTDYELTLWSSALGSRVSPGWVSDGFATNTVPLNDLRKLKDGSTLTVEFKASFNQSTDENQATAFPLRTYTVKTIVLVNPTLTDIRDSNGSVVGKITVKTTVTVTGTGSSGQRIQLMDGSSNIGSPFSVPDNSTNWSTSLTGLTAKAYNLKARALYGTGIPDSPVKAFTVTALITPTLDSVKGGGVEIPEGTTTTSTSLVLSGQASKDQVVEIFEGSGGGAQSKGEATADATTGIWTRPVTVEPGGRRLYAQSLYHSSATYSNVRTLTVAGPFAVGPASVAINGNGDFHVFLHPEWEHVGQLLPHHIYAIPVTGGTPPYYFQVVASNPVRVVNVDVYGQVYPGRSAGTATVRASDSGGNWADVQVSVTWVTQWEQAAWSVTKVQADQHVRNKGLTLPNRPQLGSFYNAFKIYGTNVCDVVGITNYGPSHPTCWFWEEEIHSSGKWWYRNLGDGGEAGIGLASMINSIGWRRSG